MTSGFILINFCMNRNYFPFTGCFVSFVSFFLSFFLSFVLLVSVFLLFVLFCLPPIFGAVKPSIHHGGAA